MDDNCIFNCEVCGKEETVPISADVPECCGKPMKKVELPLCRTQNVPEHARNYDLDEPCDDGRSGVVRDPEATES